MENNFSTIFKNLRKQANLTQEKTAEILNVTPQAISKWERGFSFPDVDLLPTISQLFNVSIDYLLGASSLDKDVSVSSYIDDAEKLYENSDFNGAVTLINTALTKFPKNPTLMYQLAKNKRALYINTPERLYEVIDIYNNCLNISNSTELTCKIHTDLIYCYEALNKVELALAHALFLPSVENCTENHLYKCSIANKAEKIKNIESCVQIMAKSIAKCLENALFDDKLKLNETTKKEISAKQKILKDHFLDFSIR